MQTIKNVPGRGILFPLLLILMSSVPGAVLGQSGARISGGTDSLTLAEVLTLARKDNARVQAALHQVEASVAREPGAGTLPDPVLQVGVMNLALPELSATMPASMAPSLQLTQRFPLAGKLGLREALAGQGTAVREASAEEVWWEVRTEVATTFFHLYQTDRQVEVLNHTLALLRDFETVARSLYSAGVGQQTDVLRSTVEVARLDADVQRMVAVRKGSAAKLNALLNRPSGTPVPSPALPSLPREIPSFEILWSWAADTRPLLTGMRLEVARAETRSELAEKAIWPDVSFGLQYGLGRMGGDYKSMGGAMVGFSLPLHAGKRQFRARDEALAQKRSAEAVLQGALANVEARIAISLADLDQDRTLLSLYREEILPQARATVESALSSYRVGAVDFLTLIDAQMAVNRFQGEYFALISSYGTALTELEMTIGRDIPVAGELIVEDR